jgi:hypothetical protein
MDRMTVDGSLAALSVAFVYFVKTRSVGKLYIVLVLACLARETGALLLGGCCIAEFVFKRFSRALLWGTAGLLALAWYWFLDAQPQMWAHRATPRWFLSRFGPGLIGRLFDLPRYPVSATIEMIARSADALALSGMLCAMIVAVVLLIKRPLGPIPIAAGLCVALAISLMNVRYWETSYEYSRVFSPLLVLTALGSVSPKRSIQAWLWGLLPTALVDIRIGLQLGPQIIGVVRGLLGH